MPQQFYFVHLPVQAVKLALKFLEEIVDVLRRDGWS
jgi:hypothetical protein